MNEKNSLRRFRIRYRDASPEAPIFTTTMRAYDREHAEEKFWDSDSMDQDWEILSIVEI